MKTYEYEGFDKDKKPNNGTVEARTGEEAILYLLQSGIYPTSLIELSVGQAKSNIKLNNLKRFRERLRAPLPRPINDIILTELHDSILKKSESKWPFMKFMVILASAVVILYFIVKLFIELGLLPGARLTP